MLKRAHRPPGNTSFLSEPQNLPEEGQDAVQDAAEEELHFPSREKAAYQERAETVTAETGNTKNFKHWHVS